MSVTYVRRGFKQLSLRCLVSALAITLSACSLMQWRVVESMNSPMTRVDQRLREGGAAKVLVVMLPGAYDAPKDFIEQGFVQVLRTKNFDLDVTLLDAHIGYYTNQQIVERLQHEIIEPARNLGYQQVWLVGISLGGYGSLLYSMRGARGIDGIFIMAPFMGSRHLPAQVAKAGGLSLWTPASQIHTASTDVDDVLWAWLKTYSMASVADTMRLPIYLGYGEDDRFIASNRLLAAVLPQQQVMTVAGGHTWGPWLALWEQFLNRAPWPKRENP
jgi:pimeloyl-ACP methyl ester carboxylesterase